MRSRFKAHSPAAIAGGSPNTFPVNSPDTFLGTRPAEAVDAAVAPARPDQGRVPTSRVFPGFRGSPAFLALAPDEEAVGDGATCAPRCWPSWPNNLATAMS
jgi:hypothetical protein